MNERSGQAPPATGAPFPRSANPGQREEVARYEYTDEAGALLFQVVRFEPKSFRARRRDGQGGWIGNLDGVRRVLYRLPQVVAADRVLVVEGEKDADNAQSLLPDAGFATTCNPFGAGKWRNEYTSALAGKTVYLCPDNDAAGRDHLQLVGLALSTAAREIRVVRLPKAVKDLSEWIDCGGNRETFAILLRDSEAFAVPAAPLGPSNALRLLPDAPADVAAVYDYTDASGALRFQVLRYRPKTFRTRRPDGQGGWHWGVEGCLPTLYHLPRVLTATTVLIVEGEKDVETAERLGLPEHWAATCSPFGVCHWHPQHSDMLAGKRVFICPDNDLPGQDHLFQVGLSLLGRASEIRVVTLPASSKDLSEWVEAGGDAAAFAALLEAAPTFAYPRDPCGLLREIAPLGGVLERIGQLHPVASEADGQNPRVDFAVREVARVFPGWVSIDPEGNPALCVRGFEALATAALQELATAIGSAQQSARELADRIDRLATKRPASTRPAG